MPEKKKKFSFHIPPVVIKILVVVLVLALLTGVALSAYAIAATFAPVRLVLDEGKTYQTMDGFGAASAWTFQDVGQNEQATQRATTLLYGDPDEYEESLGLDVVRFNIGAGTKEEAAGSPYRDTNRATESFFDSSKYTGIDSFYKKANYDFENRDVAAMNMLHACLDTGRVRTLVLFANSPHYLLTKNKSGQGTNTHENNLPEENYEAYAQYLIIIADYFRTMVADMDNPPEIYLNPVNEPQWAWGGADATQEGCHYDPEPMAKFCNVFCTALAAYNAANHCNVIPDLFESGNYKFTDLKHAKVKEYFAELKKYPFFETLDHVSVHSYAANQKVGERKRFRFWADKQLAGKEIHMSEYCVMQGGVDPSIDMGLISADVMLKDLTLLNASQWCWWLGIASGGYEDGLIYYDYEEMLASDHYEFYHNKRFPAFQQFTRYIGRGDVRIEAHTPYTPTGWDRTGVCAFRKSDGRVVVVLLNHLDRARKLRLPAGYRVSEATFTDADHDFDPLPDYSALPAKSIVTLVLERG